jgi:hypothetical protein
VSHSDAYHRTPRQSAGVTRPGPRIRIWAPAGEAAATVHKPVPAGPGPAAAEAATAARARVGFAAGAPRLSHSAARRGTRTQHAGGVSDSGVTHSVSLSLRSGRVHVSFEFTGN